MRQVFLDSTAGTGAWNMAVDERLAQLVEQGVLAVAFRVYTWEPPCISVGRFQNPVEEVDLDLASRDGICVVKRPTGGRAVWHHREVTYCLVAKEDNPLVSGDVRSSFRKVSVPLLAGLKSLGIAAEVTSGSPPAEGKRVAGNPCFTTAGAFEIAVGGRKMVGSAQARKSGVFLQHGSLLFHNDQARLLDYFPGSRTREWMERMNSVLSSGVVSLAECGFQGPPTLVREALLRAFREWVPGGLVHCPDRELVGPELDALVTKKLRLE